MLNKEQEAFVRHPLCNMRLIGIPGGGKTTTVIKKILYHVELGELSIDSFLLITFSRRACEDFIQKGSSNQKNFFSDGGFTRIWM